MARKSTKVLQFVSASHWILRPKLVRYLIAWPDKSIVRSFRMGNGVKKRSCVWLQGRLFGPCYDNNKSGSEFEIN